MPRVVDAMTEDQADCIMDIQKAVGAYSTCLTAIEVVGCLQFVIADMLDMTLNANIADDDELEN